MKKTAERINDADDASLPAPLSVRREKPPAIFEAGKEKRPKERREKTGSSVKKKKRSATPIDVVPAPPWRQVFLLGGLAGSAFLGVSLASYHATDPSFTASHAGTIRNIAGYIGSYSADLLYQSMGYTAWSVLAIGVWCAFRLAGRPQGPLWRAPILGAMWVASTVGLELVIPSAGRSFPAGGVAGRLLAQTLDGPLGRLGTGGVVGLVLIGAATLLWKFDWQPVARRVVEGVEVGAPALGRGAVRTLGGAGAGLFRFTRQAGAGGLGVLQRALRRPEPVEDEEGAEEEVAVVAPPGTRTVGLPRGAEGGPSAAPTVTRVERGAERAPVPPPPGPATVAEPVARVVRRPVSIPQDLPEPTPVPRNPNLPTGVWAAKKAPPPKPEIEQPTQVSQRILAEVEWEPTGVVRPEPTPRSAPPALSPRVSPRAHDLPTHARAPLADPPTQTQVSVAREALRAPRAPSASIPVIPRTDSPHLPLVPITDEDEPLPMPPRARRPLLEEEDDLFGPLTPTPTPTTAARPSAPAAPVTPVAQRAPVAPPMQAFVQAPVQAPVHAPVQAPVHAPVSQAPTPPVPPASQVPPVQAPPVQAPPVQAPPVQVSAAPVHAPVQAPIPPAPPVVQPPLAPRAAASQAPPSIASETALPPSFGPEVVPGNLKSGGVQDDGRALRYTGTPFRLPPLALLDEHPEVIVDTDEDHLQDLARRLTAKLENFGVQGQVVAIRPGPVITVFEYEPADGVKLSKISSLSDDLAMALKALSVRIVAPIPGRGLVGIEIPNEKRQIVWARDLFGAPAFTHGKMTLPMILGKDTEGKPYITDLARMPHLLVGGTTGSGKSVGVNTMLCSMLYTRTPDELRLILVDPKMLEFELYQDIPHLLHPVVTDPKLAAAVLAWCCKEMDERYEKLSRWKVRNIDGYNQRVEQEIAAGWDIERARKFCPPGWSDEEVLVLPKKLPYLVIVIDELSDLMMVAGKEVEEAIVRIAQKARAAGMHLICATQRPSVDVVTALIKANMPARLAYQVRQKTDGRTILDQNGAETLLGKGDLLFLPPGVSGLLRLHGPFLSDEEVRRVADFLRAQGAPEYAPPVLVDEGGGLDEEMEAEKDENYVRAVEVAMELGKISTSMIQRRLKIGYNRAARIVEIMEKEGIVGPADGVKPREVLVGRN